MSVPSIVTGRDSSSYRAGSKRPGAGVSHHNADMLDTLLPPPERAALSPSASPLADAPFDDLPLGDVLPVEFAAVNAVVTVSADRVTITRRAPNDPYGQRLTHREIPLEAIRSVEMKRPGMTPGYLHLCTGQPVPPGSDLGALTAGRYNEDTVLLSRRHLPAFEVARGLIDRLREAA
jgi:hypothetical protein